MEIEVVNPYTLNEDLAVLDMLENNLSVEDISQITGRDEYSIAKRFCNKEYSLGKLKHLAKDEQDFHGQLYRLYQTELPKDWKLNVIWRVEEYRKMLEEKFKAS